MRSTREEWAKRVQRWRDSDLTAAEFASEVGVNPRTLSYWKWRLGKESGEVGRRGTSSKVAGPKSKTARAKAVTFVEVTPPASTWWQATERIEVLVDERLVVRVPDAFDADTLRRVLTTITAEEKA